MNERELPPPPPPEDPDELTPDPDPNEEPTKPEPTGLEPVTPLTTRAPRARQRPG